VLGIGVELLREGLGEPLELSERAVPLAGARVTDQRVAFVLCAVEERTSSEAARIVGAPEPTVRTRLFRARKKLREILSERGVGESGSLSCTEIAGQA
jgi:RNA polymerase sigma-70 factor (ECF subfamily)